MIDQKTASQTWWSLLVHKPSPGRKKTRVIRVIWSHGWRGLPVGRAFLVALLQTVVCQVDGWEGSCGSKLVRSVNGIYVDLWNCMDIVPPCTTKIKKFRSPEKRDQFPEDTHPSSVFFLYWTVLLQHAAMVSTNRPGNLPLYNAIGDPVGQWWSEFFRKQKVTGGVGLRRTLQIHLRRVKDDEGKQVHVYLDVCW